ncbi:hypothetical protein EC973_004974 [Apophysomyces ossiformis]|uniref:Uncharacterized protein n=1 Tax=Apophysomyces ossiformis TaxID=679940 RepID=A0A8H7EPM1_9FUNG|nr:hypothetical protein EC973_004974 [Apophysomyces ossiformis]
MGGHSLFTGERPRDPMCGVTHRCLPEKSLALCFVIPFHEPDLVFGFRTSIQKVSKQAVPTPPMVLNLAYPYQVVTTQHESKLPPRLRFNKAPDIDCLPGHCTAPRAPSPSNCQIASLPCVPKTQIMASTSGM